MEKPKISGTLFTELTRGWKILVGVVFCVFILLFLWKGDLFGTELKKISNVFDKQDVSSESKELSGVDDNLKQEAIDESQSNKNNYQCVRYSWSGGEKQMKQEFAVFSGKYYFALSSEGVDKKTRLLMSFLGDRKKMYMWPPEADKIDLTKRGRIFDLEQIRESYGVNLAGKLLDEASESVLKDNSFSCEPLGGVMKEKLETPDLSEVEFHAASPSDQDEMFGQNDEKLGVDVLITGLVADAKNGATKSGFKAQAYSAQVALILPCDDKEHLTVSDLQSPRKRTDYTLLNLQSFEVLSESCGPNGEGTFSVKLKGKDDAQGNWAICSEARCTFSDSQP